MRISKPVWGGSLRLIWAVGLALLALGVALGGLGLLSPSVPAPASEPMPPFEEELYLRVVARWSSDGCVDVVTFTNLPQGTMFQIDAQARPMRDSRRLPIGRLVREDRQEFVLVAAPRTEVLRLFCDLAERYRRRGYLRNGILIRARVSENALKRAFPPSADPDAEQRHRIGEHGRLLRGPLVRISHPQGIFQAIGTSEAFVLEPLP